MSFVFTGDIGREVERTIAPSFARAPIRILKVPHHGSATSSSQPFLDALRPDIAVISAGRGNPFGHPVPSVLERYRNIGAAIYRTDQDGAVTVETDGTTVRVTTFTGRRLTLTTTRTITPRRLEHDDTKSTKARRRTLMIRVPSPLDDETEKYVFETMDCGFAVHKALGPGFGESIYRNAFCVELRAREIPFECEKPFVSEISR